MATTFKFSDYITQLQFVIYFKYDVIVNYFDLKFKYKNLSVNDDLLYKLEVNAIVDAIQEKEYNIFTDTRPATDASEWVIRIPEILNNMSVWYNPDTAKFTPNFSHLPELQYFNGGLDYEPNPKPTAESEAIGFSNFIGLYDKVIVSQSVARTTSGQSTNQFGNDIKLITGPNGPVYIETSTENLIGAYISSSFSRTKLHPGITILFDEDAGGQQKYFNIPIGVTKYNIVLTNIKTGESVITTLYGTLQNNPAYSPASSNIITTSPIIPGTGRGSLTLDVLGPAATGTLTTPNLLGLPFNQAKNEILAINCIPEIEEGPEPPTRNTQRNTVYEQDPTPGSPIEPGTIISVLYYGRFVPTRPV